MKNRVRLLLSLFPISLIVIPLLLMPLVHASSSQNTEYIQPSLLATGPEEEWSSTFGGADDDRGYSVQQTSDGGFIIVGLTKSFGAGEYDVYLVKTGASGNEEWSKTFGGSDWDWGSSVQQTSDGGFVIIGMTVSFGNGGRDIFLIKTNEVGNEQWSKTFGGAADDEGSSVLQTPDGGFVLVGMTASFGNGGCDVYLIKTDESGNEQWSKTFGGVYDDRGSSIQQTADGGFIIAGEIEDSMGDLDIYVIKTNSLGYHEWSETFGGSDSDWSSSIELTSDRGYIIAGVTTSFGTGADDVFLVKTDALGDEQWSRTFGGVGNDEGSSVHQTSDGGFIIAGVTTSFGSGNRDVYLVKTDSSGNELWSTTFGGSDWDVGRSMQQTADGGFIIVGSTASFSNSADVYMIKVAADVQLDSTNPIISITSPSSGQTFTTSSATVTGTASDSIGLSKVEVRVGSGSWHLASGTTSWSEAVTLSPGSNTIYARATDTSGNAGEASVSVSYDSSTVLPPWIIGAIAGMVALIVVITGAFWTGRRLTQRNVLNAQISGYRAKLDQWESEGYDVSEFIKKWFK